MLAKDAQARGWSTTLLTAAPDQSNPSNIPGLEALDRAQAIAGIREGLADLERGDVADADVTLATARRALASSK